MLFPTLSGCLVETEAIAIVRRLCDAISYLHKKEIIHRDVKPENILLKKPSDINEIRLIDFGIVHPIRNHAP